MIKQLFFLLLLGGSSVFAGSLQPRFDDLESFSKAIEVIETQSFYPTSHRELINQAISGMLHSLDPYSRLLGESDLVRLKKTSSGLSFGVGLTLEPKDSGLWVTKVADGSPAQKAGFKRGDRILKVMGQPASQFQPEEIRQTKSPISIEWNQGQTIRLTQVWYPHTGVKFFSPSPQVLVIQVEEFFTKTAALIEQELLAKQPKAVVLDLRDNPGGLVFSAVEVADLFLGPGLITQTQDRNGKPIQTYLAHKPALLPKLRLAVLINHHTVSAAEILTQSLVEAKVATSFGEKSYGKGVVQSLFPLGSGRYALLTMAKYVGPSGKSFHQVGLAPTVPVKDHWQEPRFSEKDLIYTEAVRWLNREP